MARASGSTGQNNDPANAIPERIKMLRTALNVTAAELDRLTELSAGTIGRLERSTQRVYASHLYRIAQVTGVDVGWFYRANGEAPNIGNQHELEQQRLLEAYMRITDPVLKRDMFDLVKTLSKNAND